jgi:hypothetical protein
MSLVVETNSIEYAVTADTRTFTFPFTIFSDGDVLASGIDDSDSSVVTLPAFTVSANSPDNGGSITFASAINGGGNLHLTIYRAVPLSQTILRNARQLVLAPTPTELALDRVTAQIQDLTASVTTADISGGSVDGTTIGAVTPAPATFTTCKATTSFGDGTNYTIAWNADTSSIDFTIL